MAPPKKTAPPFAVSKDARSDYPSLFHESHSDVTYHVVNDRVVQRGKVLIHLDEATADALAVYLEEEEIFDDVVDALLDALPVPEPTLPLQKILNLQMRDIWGPQGPRTLRDYLISYPNIAKMPDAVFQVSQLPGEEPRVDGYVVYGTSADRYWWDRTPRDLVVGYYHNYSHMFTSTNAEMIKYLIDKEYIQRHWDD